MKSFNDYVYFVYTGRNAQYSFRNYTHPETGMEIGYVTGYDKNKQPIYKSWFFDLETHRQIRISKDEKDREGVLAVDFLRNSPECFKSENGTYIYDGSQVGSLFKEVNEEKDAVDAVSTRAKVVKAQAEALKLKAQDLTDIAAIIGIFSDKEGIKTHRVLDFAANFPDKFLALVEDPALKIKALVKKAINDKIFKVDGKMLKWEGKTIGADEEDAISNLMKDASLLDSVKTHMKKFGS